MSITSTVNFNTKWGDHSSNKRIEESSKGAGYHEAEIENALRDMALRFERSPNQSTIKLWASDLANAGYKCAVVREVCKMVPFKMERHPSLMDIMYLLSPYRAKEVVSLDELTDLSNRCYTLLRERFMKIADQEILDRLCAAYIQKLFHHSCSFDARHNEMMVLNDWCRTYFSKDPKAILTQGSVSNLAADEGDREYFLKHLRLFAKENRL
jgi:hypothetical protein